MNYKIRLFGILTIVFAHIPYGIAQCQQFPDIPNFRSERYLEGIWYVTHSNNGSGAMDCREYHITLLPDSTMDHRTYGYMKNRKLFYTIRCLGIEQGNKGKFALACRLITGNNKSDIFLVEVAVIETDYDNFAIIYTCASYEILTEDNILVLHRQLDGNYTLAEEALSKRKMSISDFEARKNASCKTHPDLQNLKRKIN